MSGRGLGASAPRGASKLRALGQLLTVPNLGLNLFFALAFLLVVGKGHPGWLLGSLVLAAFLGARNAGHAFNQIVDRELDAKNPRTRERPLVTGALSVRGAAVVVALNVALFFAAAALINPWLTLLAVPALGLVLGYSYTKRYTASATVLLGAVQALIPAGVYLALDGGVPPPAWAAIAAMVLFGTAFESVHSMGDLGPDREQGLHSLPLALGPRQTPLVVAGLLLGATVLLSLYLWTATGPSPSVLLVTGGMGGLAAVEVYGLQTGSVPLLRLFRLHFAMGGVFLLSVLWFCASTSI